MSPRMTLSRKRVLPAIKKTWKVMMNTKVLLSYRMMYHVLSRSWILLDIQSTVDDFCNPWLLSNIHDTKQTLTLYCNAGKAIIKKNGDLKGSGPEWYYPDSITPTNY